MTAVEYFPPPLRGILENAISASSPDVDAPVARIRTIAFFESIPSWPIERARRSRFVTARRRRRKRIREPRRDACCVRWVNRCLSFGAPGDEVAHQLASSQKALTDVV